VREAYLWQRLPSSISFLLVACLRLAQSRRSCYRDSRRDAGTGGNLSYLACPPKNTRTLLPSNTTKRCRPGAELLSLVSAYLRHACCGTRSLMGSGPLWLCRLASNGDGMTTAGRRLFIGPAGSWPAHGPAHRDFPRSRCRSRSEPIDAGFSHVVTGDLPLQGSALAIANLRWRDDHDGTGHVIRPPLQR